MTVCEIMNLIIELLNVVFIARTTPTDCRNDNGKNEHDKGGHFSVKSANGHIVDKGSKSTYTCFWMSILGGSLLIVFIAISFGSYVPGLNEGTCVCNIPVIIIFLFIVT